MNAPLGPTTSEEDLPEYSPVVAGLAGEILGQEREMKAAEPKHTPVLRWPTSLLKNAAMTTKSETAEKPTTASREAKSRTEAKEEKSIAPISPPHQNTPSLSLPIFENHPNLQCSRNPNHTVLDFIHHACTAPGVGAVAPKKGEVKSRLHEGKELMLPSAG